MTWPSRDSGLDAFIAEAKQGVHTHVLEFRPSGFEDVRKRWQSDRTKLAETASAQATGRATEMQPGNGPMDVSDPELGEFVAAAKHGLEEHMLARARPVRRRWRMVGLAAVAAAALAMLATDVGSLVRRPASSLVESPVVVVPTHETGQARHGMPRNASTALPPVRSLPPPVEPQKKEGVHPKQSASASRVRSQGYRNRLQPPTKALSLAERLRSLDERAQAQWQAGDRHGAEQSYGELIRLAEARPVAELAYADLFSIARQAGRVDRMRARWSEYLGQFPEGRFADDARAGLCRTAPGSDRARCWATYLADYAHGSYREEAQRAQKVLPNGDPP